MMLHGAPALASIPHQQHMMLDDQQQEPPAQPPTRRKRKAESQDNERLSKRLSLLNLEQQGQKRYVPVENPSVQPSRRRKDGSTSFPHDGAGGIDGSMQLDDSKYKVYIYDLDDELSSSESEPEDGKVVFLPDIQKHLLANRIPPSVLANQDGELAGMEMVLYSVPSSLTVPEDKDSVRKAIIESRARVREKQRLEREGGVASTQVNDASLSVEDSSVENLSAQNTSAQHLSVEAGIPVDGMVYDADAMDVD